MVASGPANLPTSETMELKAGDTRIVDLRNVASGMEQFETGGWTQADSWFTRRGGGFVLYRRTAPRTRIAFTVKPDRSRNPFSSKTAGQVGRGVSGRQKPSARRARRRIPVSNRGRGWFAVRALACRIESPRTVSSCTSVPTSRTRRSCTNTTPGLAGRSWMPEPPHPRSAVRLLPARQRNARGIELPLRFLNPLVARLNPQITSVRPGRCFVTCALYLVTCAL